MKYSQTAIVLHWLIAGLVLVVLALCWLLVGVYPEGPGARPNVEHLYRSLGVVLGVLVVFRALWRIQHQTPPMPRTIPEWQVTAAKMNHAGLYLLMIALPGAYLMLSLFGPRSFMLFGLSVPNLLGSDRDYYEFFTGLHFACAILLTLLVVLHILAALKHWLIDRDEVMSRMLP